MKIILALCVCTGLFFHSFYGTARQNRSDSIKDVLSSSKPDTIKVFALIDLSKISSDTLALKYAEIAVDLADKNGFKRGKAEALKRIGVLYYSKADYQAAINYWEQSIELFSLINDQKGIANILSNIGAVYYNKGDKVLALDHYLKSLRVSEAILDKAGMARALNNVGGIYAEESAYEKALQYYLKSTKLYEELGAENELGACYNNIGEIYHKTGEELLALSYFRKAVMFLEYSGKYPELAETYVVIGEMYASKKDYEQAMHLLNKALEIGEKNGAKLQMAKAKNSIGNIYKFQKKYSDAIMYYKNAETLFVEIEAENKDLLNVYLGLSACYEALDDHKKAFMYQVLITKINSSLYNIDKDNKLASLQFNFDLEKKQAQIDLLTKDNQLIELALEKQKLVNYTIGVVLVLFLIIAIFFYHNIQIKKKANKLLTLRNEEINLQKEEIAAQRDNLNAQNTEIEKLVLNILPKEVAQELKDTGHATPKYYESVSVLFTDFVQFSSIAETVTAQELIEELNACFIAFDDIIEQFGLEKIKTIGDSYMCACGIPSPVENHAFMAVQAGLAIQKYMDEENIKRKGRGERLWHLRIGIHTGPVVAGVVGKKKFAYDIWGSTVNVASRMESNGSQDKVNISSATYELIKNKYECHYRGKVMAKNIGDVDMYFVEQAIGAPEELTMENGKLKRTE